MISNDYSITLRYILYEILIYTFIPLLCVESSQMLYEFTSTFYEIILKLVCVHACIING